MDINNRETTVSRERGEKDEEGTKLTQKRHRKRKDEKTEHKSASINQKWQTQLEVNSDQG